MNAPRSLLEQQLAPAKRVLDAIAPDTVARFDVLEALASLVGRCPIDALRAALPAEHTLTSAEATARAQDVLTLLERHLPVHYGLSALSRPRLTDAEQRTSGAYHTDHRLARFVAERARPHLVRGARVIDPAAGSGMLLVAATRVATDGDPRRAAQWLAESVTAWDRSADALRGAAIALAACTDDAGALAQMVERWRCHDSLLTPLGGDAGAYDVVLGNPPWEKLKVSRHEHAKAAGEERYYGEDDEGLDVDGLFASRASLAEYGRALSARFPRLGAGEPDLYRAFVELFVELTGSRGVISALVPAGLLRAQGTAALRRHLLDESRHLSVAVLDNRARFFSIDTRFKFLAIAVERGDRGERGPIVLEHARGTDDGVERTGRAELARDSLAALRPDLTIPEVRSDEEWALFERMCRAVAATSDARPSEPELVRELDMTRDRALFERSPGEPGAPGGPRLPLVEGRMVHQHRFGAKVHRAGTGRRARWEPRALGESVIGPQFWVAPDALPPSVRARAARLRAGFCDITSQTNERSMLAALIPAGVVCGNKVPTVTFADDASDTRLLSWVAIVNSLPFDWALRRVVTTTVNYFVLRSVPMPALAPGIAQELAAAARALWDADRGVAPLGAWAVAELRAYVDVEVAR
ncbi:N-6 DNA methylase, partial [Myxococcota bacterium]|nr:N-6 DNA methylase [Myxococcota bacterium]